MSDSTTKPYLSIVAVSRNDNHGGDLNTRTQTFINSLAAMCKRHELRAELIMVEWNPPADRPSLEEELQWPSSDGYLTYRVVTVPREVHNQLEVADRIPLYQMIGKNVGILRAKGDFVLATNIDLIFSDGLMKTIANGNLQAGHYYRADRFDVPADVMEYDDIEEQLAYCNNSKNLLRVNARLGTFPAETLKQFESFSSKKYRLFISKVKHFALEYLRERKHVLKTAPLTSKVNPLRHIRFLYHTLTKPFIGVYNLYLDVYFDGEIKRKPHTNACGDFTLLAKSDWEKLRAYPEYKMYSWHLDSILIHHARGFGFQEIVFNDPVYHIEHGGGWSPEQEQKLWERLTKRDIPYLTNEDLTQHMKWIQDNPTILFNESSWGMVDEDLPDKQLAPQKMTRSAA
ncbi:MAG: hypothetical protein MPJ24_02295 [Pirellulaceae bacterium]|nr:hypothetical protein [Pirellulaceae bacterium]